MGKRKKKKYLSYPLWSKEGREEFAKALKRMEIKERGVEEGK